MVSVSEPPDRPPLSPVQEACPPERNAVLTEAAADEAEVPLPSSPQTFFLGGIFALGVFAALYVASSIILPVVLALVLNLLLQPAVHLLGRVHLPRALGALFAILLAIGALVGLVAALSVPAAIWAKRLPEGIPRLEAHLVVLKGPIQALQMVIQQAEQVADAPGQKGSIMAVRRDLGLTGALFAGTRAVLDGLFTTVLVLYFLLVSGDTFLRRIVEILPKFRDKRQAVDISQQIQEDISAYLVTITAMNAAVGGRDLGRDVSLRARGPFVMGDHSLLAQLHSNFGAAFWDLHLLARRDAELRQLMVGFAAGGTLLRHPSRRG